MQERGKKSALFFGHLLCIFILIYCMADSEIFAREEEERYTVERPAQSGLYQTNLTSTPLPTLTETPVPTETPTPTETPFPKETPTPTETPFPTETPEQAAEPETKQEEVKQKVLADISGGKYDSLDNEKSSWWFRRKSNHVPSGSGEEFNISEFQGYYLNKEVEEGDKVIYLTLDCGYSSSNTDIILDTLKKHNVKVTFFVTKFFLDSSPKQVHRMVEEGHIVANHSVNHADLTSLSAEKMYEEIVGCEEAFYKLTGKQMSLFFRPPTGAYSRRSMQITQDLGYKSVFWSIAYKDYDEKNQPGKEYVLEHFREYHHSGAIALMHNDSVSNMEAMDELLTFLEEQGYRFGTLDELQ